MLIYLLKYFFVDYTNLCSDDCSKCAFLFYAFPLYLGFFTYTSVMFREISNGNGLAPFIILMILSLEAFISCLCIKPFIKRERFDPYTEPILNL